MRVVVLTGNASLDLVAIGTRVKVRWVLTFAQRLDLLSSPAFSSPNGRLATIIHTRLSSRSHHFLLLHHLGQPAPLCTITHERGDMGLFSSLQACPDARQLTVTIRIGEDRATAA